MALLKINFATAEEFRTLPGIGEKRATLLFQLREKYGYINEELLAVVFGGPVSKAILNMIDFTPNVSKKLEVQYQSVVEKGSSGDDDDDVGDGLDLRDILSAPTSEKQSRAVSRPDQLGVLHSQVEHSYSATEDVPRLLHFLPEVPDSQLAGYIHPYNPSTKRPQRLSFSKPKSVLPLIQTPNLGTEPNVKVKHETNASHVRTKNRKVSSVQKEYTDRDSSSRHQKRCHKSLSGSRSRDSSKSGSYKGRASSTKRKVEHKGHGKSHRDHTSTRTRDLSHARSSTRRHMRPGRNDSRSSSSSYDRSRDRSRKDYKYRSKRRTHQYLSSSVSSDSSESRSRSVRRRRKQYSKRNASPQYHSSKSKNRYYFSDTSSNADEMSDHGYHARQHGNLKRMPKNLRFDGKGS